MRVVQNTREGGWAHASKVAVRQCVKASIGTWLALVASIKQCALTSLVANESYMQQKVKIFEFELDPDEQQRQTIHIYAGASRYIFNKGLILLTELERQLGQPIPYNDLFVWLDEQLKSEETPWLASIPLYLLVNSLNDLIETHKKHWNDLDEPIKFRKKGRTDSFYFSSGIDLDCANGCVLLPNIGWVKVLIEGKVPGILNEVTLSRKGRRWFGQFEMLLDEFI